MVCISLHFQRMPAVSLDVFCSRLMACAPRQGMSAQRDVTCRQHRRSLADCMR
jgi:hypothetical protein